MGRAVNINDLVDAFDLQSTFLVFFLDKNTGELISITEEEITAIESGDLSEDLAFMKDILSSERYLEIPDIDKKALMEEFCSFVEDIEMKNALLEGIDEQDAFTAFNTKVHFYQLEEDWFVFIEDRLTDIAIGWCEENALPYIDVPREEKADWL